MEYDANNLRQEQAQQKGSERSFVVMPRHFPFRNIPIATSGASIYIDEPQLASQNAPKPSRWCLM